MAEQLMVYEAGDRFVTMATDGRVKVYEVAFNGRVYVSCEWPEERAPRDPRVSPGSQVGR